VRVLSLTIAIVRNNLPRGIVLYNRDISHPAALQRMNEFRRDVFEMGTNWRFLQYRQPRSLLSNKGAQIFDSQWIFRVFKIFAQSFYYLQVALMTDTTANIGIHILLNSLYVS